MILSRWAPNCYQAIIGLHLSAIALWRIYLFAAARYAGTPRLTSGVAVAGVERPDSGLVAADEVLQRMGGSAHR